LRLGRSAAARAAGLALTRRTVHVGSAGWPHGAGADQQCATKSYLLELSGRPALHIQELYNPEYFPPAERRPSITIATPARATPARTRQGSGC
jgi:hypothetical protein